MTQSIVATQWKDQDSRGKYSQEEGDSQRSLGLIGLVPDIGEADQSFIDRCSWEGALRYAVQRSRKDDFEIADDVGISHSYMCKILKGTASLSGRRLVKFMQHTQCIAPLQWLADQMGYELKPKKTALEEQLEATKRLAAQLAKQIEQQRQAA